MAKVESLPKAKNMIMVHAAQNQPFLDSASILQSNRKSLGFVLALDAAAQGQKDIVCIVLLVCALSGCMGLSQKKNLKIWKL